jgi:hypothetical protein
MPGPVRWFAEHQPVTSIVNTIRALLTEQPVGGDIGIALAWCAGILVVAYVFATARPRRAGLGQSRRRVPRERTVARRHHSSRRSRISSLPAAPNSGQYRVTGASRSGSPRWTSRWAHLTEAVRSCLG